MKNEVVNRCPGCSRRCPMQSVRCKYGRKYFASLAEAENEKPKYEWEKYVSRDGLAHRLLLVTRKTRKALCKGSISEADLISAFSEGERIVLKSILAKMAALTD